MLLFVIFTIIIPIAIFFVLYILTKRILLTIFLGIVINLILFGLLGYFIYLDFNNTKNGFENENKIFLLKEDNKILTGVKVLPLKEINDKSFEELSEEELNNFSFYYKNNDLEPILKNNFKLVILDISFIENGVSDDAVIEQDSLRISKKEALSILRGEEINNVFNVKSSEVRLFVLSSSITKSLENKGILYVIESYKNNEIIIYKETILFKAIKNIPNFIYKIVEEKITLN